MAGENPCIDTKDVLKLLILISRSFKRVDLIIDCCTVIFPAIRENRVLIDTTGVGTTAKAFRLSE